MFQKIAIIELYDHGEVLIDSYFLLKDFSQEILICTTSDIRDHLPSRMVDAANLSWQIMANSQNRGRFLKESSDLILECELIFLLTINRPFNIYSNLPFLSKTILLIHNVHAFFSPYHHIAWSGNKVTEILLRVIRFYGCGDHFHLRSILNRTRAWAFPTREVHQYSEENGWGMPGKLTLTLPLGLFEPNSNKIDSRYDFCVCVPGTIKNNGRDYNLLYEAVEQLLQDKQKRIRLCLLGIPQKNYGLKIQAIFRELSTAFPQLDLVLFDQQIPQRTYDDELQKASFLILPLQSNSRYDAFSERLGYSTSSGGINDMSRFGIPTLIPSFYPLEDWRERLGEIYKDKDHLCELIKKWVTFKPYEAKRAWYLSNRIETEKVKEQLRTELLRLKS